eukprot:745680-Rhodomonas_salina.1
MVLRDFCGTAARDVGMGGMVWCYAIGITEARFVLLICGMLLRGVVVCYYAVSWYAATRHRDADPNKRGPPSLSPSSSSSPALLFLRSLPPSLPPSLPTDVLSWRMVLHACYAMSGTELAYGATRLLCDVRY